MKKILLLSTIASTMILAAGNVEPVMAEATKIKAPMAKDFLIFNNIEGVGQIRPRYEGVFTDNDVGDAAAYTVRTTLGIKAGLFQVDGLSTYLEAMGVSAAGHFWDLGIGGANQGVYNVVPDPAQSRFTQAFIDYKAGDTLLRAGRQDFDLDNVRFIGTVDWRQMPQTYDAVSVTDNSIEGLNLLAAYVWQIHTIFAENTRVRMPWSNRGDQFDTGSVILHAAYDVIPNLAVTSYGYLLEDIHDTWGVLAQGKVAVADSTKLSYRAEYAIQRDATFEDHISNARADSDYINLSATLNMSGFLLGAQYEVLGAGKNGNASFTTPLGTNHAHNGWADIWLGVAHTPDGLSDASAWLGYKTQAFGLAKIIYHDFSTDRNNYDLGWEIDAIYKRAIPGIKGLHGMLKGGWYTAGEDVNVMTIAGVVDKTVVWAMLDYQF